MVSHVTVSGVWREKGKVSHVTVSVVWMDAATLFVSALIHSFKDLSTRTRSLLQEGSSVGLPDMVLQHMQRCSSHPCAGFATLPRHRSALRH